MTPPEKRRWWSCRETAEVLGLSISGVRKMISRNEICAVHIGRTLRIDGRRLTADLENQLKGAR